MQTRKIVSYSGFLLQGIFLRKGVQEGRQKKWQKRLEKLATKISIHQCSIPPVPIPRNITAVFFNTMIEGIAIGISTTAVVHTIRRSGDPKSDVPSPKENSRFFWVSVKTTYLHEGIVSSTLKIYEINFKMLISGPCLVAIWRASLLTVLRKMMPQM